MKILLVSVFFYPQNAIATLRVGQWAKYWSEQGHDVTVLTTQKYPFMVNCDYNYILPNRIKIVEVPYLPRYFRTTKSSIPTPQEGSTRLNESHIIARIKRSTKTLRTMLGAFFDIYTLWIFPAKRAGTVLVSTEKFDLIISSFSPSAAHIVASYLKKKAQHSIWIADYRDLWTDNHLSRASWVFRKIGEAIEKKVIAKADILTTVSHPLAKILQDKFPNIPTYTIENGFDSQEFPKWKETLKHQVLQIHFPIIISYTGTIYPGKRDPEPLFKAISELIQEGDITTAQIQVHFFGNNLYEVNKILKKTPIYTPFVTLFGMRTRQEALQAQKNSTLLLFLEWNDPSAKGVLTGKLFEYLVSGKAILAVGIDYHNSAGELIKKSGTGICCIDKEEIKNILLSIIKTQKINFYNPDIDIIQKYSREKQALAIINLLDKHKKKNVRI